ncbi:MAG TPA: hypothetical protein VIL26_05995 [Clostridia bacterium]
MTIQAFLKMQIIKKYLNKIKSKKHFDADSSEQYKLDPKAEEKSHNSHYFSGHGINGQSLVFRLGEISNNDSEIWFAYSDGTGNNYICAHQKAESDQTVINITCIEPGKKWKIQFSGGIIQDTKTPLNIWSNPKGVRVIPAVFDGEFVADHDIFDFNTQMDVTPMARAITLMPKFPKQFLKELKENNNPVYYEQKGKIQGVLNISGKKIVIDLPAVRTHAYGKRDLNVQNRHIRIYAFTNNNQFININLLGHSQIKELQSGYKIINDKIVCLDSCTSIQEIPSDGKVPARFEILASFLDGKKLVVKCEKECQFEFPFENGSYTVYEGLAKFDINGTRARGVIEFGYNTSEIIL